MKVCFVAVAAALTLGACQQTVSQMNYTQLGAFVADMGKRCDAQGVRRGTKEMEHCIAVEVRREATIREQRRAALIAFANSQTQTSCRRSIMGGFNCTTW
jgi:hypothetical protein